jgi:hypothetical protein
MIDYTKINADDDNKEKPWQPTPEEFGDLLCDENRYPFADAMELSLRNYLLFRPETRGLGRQKITVRALWEQINVTCFGWNFESFIRALDALVEGEQITLMPDHCGGVIVAYMPAPVI